MDRARPPAERSPSPAEPFVALEALLAPYAGTALSLDEVLLRLSPKDRARVEERRDHAEALHAGAATPRVPARSGHGRRH